MQQQRFDARTAWVLFTLLASFCAPLSGGESPSPAKHFVRVSPRDSRYFEFSDGQPYIPIGLNMIGPRRDEGFSSMQRWIEKLAANGGTFIRIWMGSPYFDVEHTRSGEYDQKKAGRIARLLRLCGKHGVKVKMCIESFRHFGTRTQAWSAKPLHLVANGGPATDIADFFDGRRSREQFKRKLAWFQDQFGSDPAVFGWELWNEMNTVAGGDYMAWTEVMLAELHRLFPRNLCMQSLGSFDRERKRRLHQRLSIMKGNDVAQVHRYLDLGAEVAACKGPADIMAADAVGEIRAFKPGRPILLAESGAVEPNHTGPFRLYKKDTAGIILHDVLFAPFFAGTAGPGHTWHWDAYVDANDLWWHFGRFAAVMKDLDPAAERFEPMSIQHPRLRVYVLRGKRTALVWCRDKRNTWMRELRDGRPPEQITGATLDGSALPKAARIRAYDPWTDQWRTLVPQASRITLPAFSRSLVLRLQRATP